MVRRILATVALLAGAPLGAAEVCAGGGSCDIQEGGDDDSFAAAQLRPAARHRRSAQRALGLLQLDGYYWPTQPGDINDLRTWCTVGGVDGEAYKCVQPKAKGDDEFGLSIATIEGGTWGKIQLGVFKGLEQAFTQAVEHFLLDDNVHAFMGNAGWFTWYQYQVSTIMRDLVIKYKKKGVALKRKPWLGGSPAMLAAVGGLIKGVGKAGEKILPIYDWDLLKQPNDRILLLTSNTKLTDPSLLTGLLTALGLPVKKGDSLADVRSVLRKTLHVEAPECDHWTKAFLVFLVQMYGLLEKELDKDSLKLWVSVVAQKIILLPWQTTIGYGIAVTNPGAMFHNVPALIRGSSTSASELLGNLFQQQRSGLNIVGIIMESTEMPAYSNWIRNVTGLPVWDSTVVGKCLMDAAPDYDALNAQEVGNSPELFNNPSFHKCMMGWWDAKRYDLRAGFQRDGDIKHYDSLNLTTRQLDHLTCTGGRPVPGKAIGRLMNQFDTGKFGPKKVHSSCLSASPCGGRTWHGETCPVSAYGGMFSSFSGCFCEGNCPAGYYCGGDEAYDIAGLVGIPGGQAYIYGVHGDGYANYTWP